MTKIFDLKFETHGGGSLFETGTLIRDREGDLFRVLFIDEGRIFMQKLGTPRDVVHTRTVAQEDFEKYGYSVVEE